MLYKFFSFLSPSFTAAILTRFPFRSLFSTLLLLSTVLLPFLTFSPAIPYLSCSPFLCSFSFPMSPRSLFSFNLSPHFPSFLRFSYLTPSCISFVPFSLYLHFSFLLPSFVFSSSSPFTIFSPFHFFMSPLLSSFLAP